MTSRERVRAVLDGEVPDRVPIVIGASNATGIKSGAYRRLARFLGHHGEHRAIYDWPELGTVLPDEEMMARLRSDVRPVLDSFPPTTL